MNTRLRPFVVLSLMSFLAISMASAQTFRFVVWGDSRSDGSNSVVNTTVLSTLSNQANSLSPPPAFTLFTGDLCINFDTTCTASNDTGWKYAIDGGGSNTIFDITFVTRGNHDTNSPRAWQKFFDMSAVASSLYASNFAKLVTDETYSFDYDSYHFVSVDVPGDVSLISPREIRWLDADLAAAEARGVVHTFLFWHGPIYCVDGHCPSDPPAKLISVINNHTSIVASFHGHEHVSAHTTLDSSRIQGLTHTFQQFVAGAAGAPQDGYSCLAGRSDYCNDSQFGFVTVDVNGNQVTVTQYLDGKAGTSWTF